MKRTDRRDHLREMSKDPTLLLAYLGIRQAMRGAGLSIRSLDEGFVVFVIPPGQSSRAYEDAMHVLLDVSDEEWAGKYGNVRLTHHNKKRRSVDGPISVFDLKGLAVLIATQINDVPKDVRFAAQKILHIGSPTAYHINAARRITGRSALSNEDAVLLASRPQNIVTAALFKKSIGTDEMNALIDLERANIEGPSLFDLPGYEELKPWARGIRIDVEKWRRGNLHWKAIARGALVSGPPGTGKTFFAGALAASLEFKLVTTTVGTWQSAGHLDETLNAMRKSFDDANSAGGAVLFIDEFDSIGTRPVRPRGHQSEQYWQIVINEFLSQMNNIGEGVLVIGATNNPEWIDPAILRAGRIERSFVLELPDKSARAEILRYHLGSALPFEALLEVAQHLEGKSAADLEELARNARKIARDEDRDFELKDIQGILPERRMYTVEQQFQLAVHEAGHALVALSLGYAHSATIEIRDSFDPSANGHLGGLTSYGLVENHFPTENDLLDRIAVCLSGMAAEAVVLESRSIGSGGTVGSDVERATSIARRMVGSYGLGKTPIFVSVVEGIRDTALPNVLEMEVIDILQAQYSRVVARLTNEKEQLVALAADVVSNRSVKIERTSSTRG